MLDGVGGREEDSRGWWWRGCGGGGRDRLKAVGGDGTGWCRWGRVLIGGGLGGTRLATTLETFHAVLLGGVIEAEKMVVERTLPAEAAVAVGVGAAVRLFVRVYPEMTLQVVLAVKDLGAPRMGAAMGGAHVDVMGGVGGRMGGGRMGVLGEGE